MKLNMTQAAKAVGKSRKTLYRHIDSGKLSREEDDLGNPVIDVSELQRVYGKLDIDATSDTAGQSVTKQQSVTPQGTLETELLKRDLNHLQEKYDLERERREQAEEEVAKLLGIVETQTRQLAAPSELEKKQPEKKGFWGRLFGG